MRFKSYLKEEKPAETSIENLPGDVIEFLTTHCKESLLQYQKNGTCLWRSSSTEVPVAEIRKKYETKRESQSPWTKLIFEFSLHNPHWKKYPARDESTFCSGKISGVRYHDESIYVILPIDDLRYGICPGKDFNVDSFKLVQEKLHSEHNAAALIGVLDDILSDFSNKKPDDDFAVWCKQIDDIVAEIEKQGKSVPDVMYKIVTQKHWTAGESMKKLLNTFWQLWNHKNGGNLYKLFEGLLDPELNEFKLGTFKQLPLGKVQEIWFSGAFVMVNRKHAGELLNIQVE